LYRLRKTLVILACVAPVLTLAALYWLVTQVLMIPGVPDAKTPPDRVAQFIIHEKGLPRLERAGFEAFLNVQLARLLRDRPFRDRFLVEVRTASSDDQKAFRTHLFDTFKALVLRDADHYFELAGDARAAYLDERIVAYNRMKAFGGDVTIDKGDLFGAAAPSAEEMLGLVTGRTTAEERQRALTYGAALKTRIDEILAEPALKAEFEARIASPPP
jgi:hypothetical protein